MNPESIEIAAPTRAVKARPLNVAAPVRFSQTLRSHALALPRLPLATLQINVGKLCNLAKRRVAYSKQALESMRIKQDVAASFFSRSVNIVKRSVTLLGIFLILVRKCFDYFVLSSCVFVVTARLRS